jgi:hypothetical protein
MRFKQYLLENIFQEIKLNYVIEGVVPRLSTQDIFPDTRTPYYSKKLSGLDQITELPNIIDGTMIHYPKNAFIDPKTGNFKFTVYHGGEIPIDKPSDILTPLTIPKQKDTLRSLTIGNIRRTAGTQTPQMPQDTYRGLFTTPDPIAAAAYEMPGTSQIPKTSKITSFDIDLHPSELLQFKTYDEYQDHMDKLYQERYGKQFNIQKPLHHSFKRDMRLTGVNRSLRSKGIKAISYGAGTGPAIQSGEFLILDPSIVKSVSDRTSDTEKLLLNPGSNPKPIERWLTKMSAAGAAGNAAAGTVTGSALTQSAHAASDVLAGVQTVAKGAKPLKSIGKAALKAVPVVGTMASLYAMADRAQAGDYVGAGLEAASEVADYVPLIGSATSLGIQGYLADRDASPEEKEAAKRQTARQTMRSVAATMPRY